MCSIDAKSIILIRRSASKWRSREIRERGTCNPRFRRTLPCVRGSAPAPWSRGAPWPGRAGCLWPRSRSCTQFLSRRRGTVLVGEIWFFLQFFEDLDLPGEVFGVVAAEGVFVGGPAEPVGVAPQLIGEVGVVVLQRILLHVLVGVGGPAALRKVASRVPVSWPHVLVVPAVAREVRGVGAQLRTRPSALEQVLGHWALYPIAGLAGESLEVGGADVEVRALEAAVFLIAVDEVGDLLLREEAALVDGVLGEVRPDNVEPAEVAAAVAVAAHAALLVMAEVALLQLPRSPPEVLLLGEALLVVVPAALGLREVAGGVEGLHF